MNGFLFLISLLVLSTGIAYAQPLDQIHSQITSNDDISAVIQLDWNYDELVKKYEIGCVSCIPNTSYFSTETSFNLKNVTAFPNSSYAMLYIIAYDSNDEIIDAKQILVDIKS
ncbi:hypothetical protein [Nitrosopumilus ureiphilus]|uniref:Uncharacterized protein n=1 Tax=Nitrosopumilus ureiphilus TaxID=1470067 RepID=A0A7D5R5F9_9ARCH|nr:hypothetical protein [Nitrosopumilus ureiphilus]QLH05838.1 hypothetical protein C5F50_01140 [Nitrosopumilus ureiphilus]